MEIDNITQLSISVENSIRSVKITDIHTHLFSQYFGELFLYGIDELLTYHYLIAETFRMSDIPYEEFWGMSKKQQADLVWKTLFIDNTPISEACRSIITIFSSLGLDVNNKNLDYYRSYFESRNLKDYINEVFDIVGLKCVVMTNDPFDSNERAIWESGYAKDIRFKAALRVDVLLNSWDTACAKLSAWGYDVHPDLSGSTFNEIQRFLIHWIDTIEALYCAVSLPPDFAMGDGSVRSKIIENCIIPVCKAKKLPFALMIGVTRGVNPQLKLAGDSLGRADIHAIEYLCAKYPENKFLITMLSLENQHELIVTTRKFRNLMLFGCWWFMNNPAIIESLTKMRLELLGTSFIPQHSDCRVFEQLISKWTHSKAVISKVLVEEYSSLMASGFTLTDEQIARDIHNLFGGNFWRFVGDYES